MMWRPLHIDVMPAKGRTHATLQNRSDSNVDPRLRRDDGYTSTLPSLPTALPISSSETSSPSSIS
jgi:hypothetical protein